MLYGIRFAGMRVKKLTSLEHFLEHFSLRVMMIFLFAWSYIALAAAQKKSPTVSDLDFLKLLSGWFLR